METIERLLIISHVCHFGHREQLSAFGPYVREIDIWADLFPKVYIASPFRDEEPPSDCVAFTRSNISIVPQKETGGTTVRAKMLQVLSVPVLLWGLCRAMRHADAIHVRCPGNLGLLGAVLAPLFSRRIIAKYAGPWNGYEAEAFSEALQRLVLRSRWWRKGIVTVYGGFPNQPAHIVPFLPAMMTSEQVRKAAMVATEKDLSTPVRLMFSGRLVDWKGVDVLIRAFKLLVDEDLPFTLTIVGDGPERESLRRLTEELNLERQIRFVGAVPYEDVMEWYAKAHILVLPSLRREGWGKVLIEAMCHGLVCVGSDVDLVPWQLEGRGYVFPSGDARALAAVLKEIVRNPSAYKPLSLRSAEWAKTYSLEGLKVALKDLMSKRWGMAFEVGAPAAMHSGSKL